VARSFRSSSTIRRPSSKASIRTALEHLNAGRLAEAEFALRLVLTGRPNDGDAHNLLAGVQLQKGKLPEALSSLQRAARAKPRDADIHFNLAGAYRRSGDLGKSIEHYESATQLRRGYVEAEALKGEAYKELGDWKRAQDCYEAALSYNPTSMVALNGLGQCRERAGDPQAASEAFKTALETVPAHDKLNRARLLANFGHTRLQAGDGQEGLSALADAVTLAPDNEELLMLLAQNLRHVRVIPEGDAFAQVLTRILDHKAVNPRTLSSAAAFALKAKSQLGDEIGRLAASNAPIGKDVLDAVSQCPLLFAHLRNAPITDAELELALTRVRRELALSQQVGALLELLCALARQAYLNEYVWHVTADEDAAIDAMCANLASDPKWEKHTLVACYRPLGSLVDFALDRKGAPPEVLAVLRQQIDEPAEETALAAAIETLTPIADATSMSVRAQYEENPYPRWVRVGTPASKPFRRAVHNKLPHLTPEQLPLRDEPRVLVAGCGTGLEAMNVVNAFQMSSLLAVDLSRASLGYAGRKFKEQGIADVAWRQGDILELGQIEDRFDLVHSFGVIHHMAEPAKGLGVLASLLNPGGYLFVGLYSTIARQPIIAARALIAARQIPSTADGIRGLRQEVLKGETEPEISGIATPASDFWTTSECRDLMFHVEEHQFTLLEIGEMLAREGLEFLGLELHHAPDLSRFRAQNPDPSSLQSLQAWHAFEEQNPETFGGTYRIWARKPA
jgi:tetratricopeptide (TPR) repeat protein/2-polyprenyl-3-methyl-5-hydroxy-6-metoxy-1,4-benzoquinol methylase